MLDAAALLVGYTTLGLTALFALLVVLDCTLNAVVYTWLSLWIQGDVSHVSWPRYLNFLGREFWYGFKMLHAMSMRGDNRAFKFNSWRDFERKEYTDE